MENFWVINNNKKCMLVEYDNLNKKVDIKDRIPDTLIDTLISNTTNYEQINNFLNSRVTTTSSSRTFLESNNIDADNLIKVLKLTNGEKVTDKISINFKLN